ncbi:MAG: MFS transporter [Trueperaceae bacterium]|nr:MAG: MFS transporter [Trueperaceae bacterium]
MSLAAATGRWTVVTVFMLAYWLSFFYRSANAVIADDLARDVGVGPGSLGFMTSVFFLSIAAVQLPLGTALDRFGARFVTPLMLVVTVIGSIVFATAFDVVGLVAGRALMGMGMAGVLMGALKVFAAWFDPRAFATVSSAFVGIGSLGALLAATPLAWFAAEFGWRAAFLWGAALVGLAAIGIALVVREPRPVAGGSRSTTTTSGFAVMFGDASFWRLALLTFAVKGGLFAWQGLWLGPMLTQGVGTSAIEAGNVLLALGLGAAAGFLGSGPVASRIGVARTLAAGAAAFLLLLVLWLLVTPAWPQASLQVLAAALGLTGASSVMGFALARDAFPHMPGHAVTAVNLFGIGGGALLQWGLGAVIGAFTSDDGSHPPMAFRAALIVTAALVGVALARFAPLALRPKPRSPAS